MHKVTYIKLLLVVEENLEKSRIVLDYLFLHQLQTEQNNNNNETSSNVCP